MLESFSIQAVEIIEKAKELAHEMESDIVGSEHLLLALYKTSDTICHFLFSELNIKEENIINVLKKMEVIHKKNDNSVFSVKFVEIIKNASLVAQDTKSENVFDEHLFYSLLEIKDSVAYEIINCLNIDVDEMLLDIEEIFNFFEDDKCDEDPFPYLRLINKDNFSHPYISRKDYIKQIIYILKKKQKNNPLLIGNAGVGKSALIEGLSLKLKDEVIYELDLGAIVAGTKYRGELEEKLIKALDYIKTKKAIVFIDEIHNIVGAGANDGSLDIANILKPYLTKSNIKVIGATTIDEYHKYISKDKALTRRFQNIYIDEPSKEETYKILKQIKKYYEEYHHVTYDNLLLKEIISKCDLYLPNRCFPDKAIDVIDQLGAVASTDKTNNLKRCLNKVIYSLNGIKPKSIKQIHKCNLIYPELIPYYELFITKTKNVRNIANIGVNSRFKIDYLINDINKVFGVKSECFLELDLSSYNDLSSLTNLIGSSKGYVGYEQGGVLFEHIIKYPLSVVYFKNFKDAHYSIRNYLTKLIKKTFVYDNKGRKIFFSNTIFIFDQITFCKKHLGFENKENLLEESLFDIVLHNLDENCIINK